VTLVRVALGLAPFHIMCFFNTFFFAALIELLYLEFEIIPQPFVGGLHPKL